CQLQVVDADSAGHQVAEQALEEGIQGCNTIFLASNLAIDSCHRLANQLLFWQWRSWDQRLPHLPALEGVLCQAPLRCCGLPFPRGRVKEATQERTAEQ